MRTFDLIAILVVMAAVFSYINFKVLKLPAAIGLMVLTLLFSVGVFLVALFRPDLKSLVTSFLDRFDFDEVLLHGVLGFLLFAEALHVDLGHLARFRWPIAVLATVAVLPSTVIVGNLTWWMLGLIGLPMSFLDCLLYGALISPTDPIAVLGLPKRVGVSKSLEVQIAGEFLFNDGMASSCSRASSRSHRVSNGRAWGILPACSSRRRSVGPCSGWLSDCWSSRC